MRCAPAALRVKLMAVAELQRCCSQLGRPPPTLPCNAVTLVYLFEKIWLAQRDHRSKHRVFRSWRKCEAPVQQWVAPLQAVVRCPHVKNPYGSMALPILLTRWPLGIPKENPCNIGMPADICTVKDVVDNLRKGRSGCVGYLKAELLAVRRHAYSRIFWHYVEDHFPHLDVHDDEQLRGSRQYNWSVLLHATS